MLVKYKFKPGLFIDNRIKTLKTMLVKYKSQ